MLRVVGIGIFAIAILGSVGVGTAEAINNSGIVYCDTNQNGVIDDGDTPLANIRVTADSADGTFHGEAITDNNGFYLIPLPGFGNYTFAIDTASIPNSASVIGAGYPVTALPGNSPYTVALDANFPTTVYYLVDGAACAGVECWMTAGGVKFSPVTGTNVAQHGPQDSFGGNVYPGCNADNGNDGGQWNHVAHSQKLHFQGFQIEVTACGNVPGIPAGSTSPVTPVNFIEFRGTGRLKGIHGNKDDFGTVEFEARVEDRGEPGNEHGNHGPTLETDRYFLRVFNGGNTLLLVDGDQNPATKDPITITGGNLQLHFNPCPEQ
jgi:hypothetical protein